MKNLDGRKLDIQNAVSLLLEEGFELKAPIVEPVEQVGDGKIEVGRLGCTGFSDHGNWYKFHVAGNGSKYMYDIPEDKFPAIKEAIQSVLNNEPLYTKKEMNECWNHGKNQGSYGSTFQAYMNYFYSDYYLSKGKYAALSSKQSPSMPENVEPVRVSTDWEIVKAYHPASKQVIGDGTAFDNKIIERVKEGSSKWLIHSVKRLSDGVVFTVGDKVIWPFGERTIESFKSDSLGHLDIIHETGLFTNDSDTGTFKSLRKPSTIDTPKEPFQWTEASMVEFFGEIGTTNSSLSVELLRRWYEFKRAK